MPKALPTPADLHPELLTQAILAGDVVKPPEWFRDVAQRFDLSGWLRVPIQLFPYRYARSAEPERRRLMVIATGRVEADGKRWLHISYSRPTRIPNYEDLCLVKDRFIGADRQAISVHPPASQHVNIHATCLHLWHCLDGDGLPDFRTAGGTGI